MKAYPMIVVRDVEASSGWYQRFLGLESAHGGSEFEMLMADGELRLCLHHADAEEHEVLTVPGGDVPAGAGVLLYFSVPDVTPFFERAIAMGADLVDEPHRNEKAHAIEFSLRDPDGYAITVSQWMG